jgi:hypothetical protein
MYVRVYVYICMYVYMNKCAYAYMHPHIHTHTYTHLYARHLPSVLPLCLCLRRGEGGVDRIAERCICMCIEYIGVVSVVSQYIVYNCVYY